MSGPCGVSHLAVVTPDLDGYRAFYEDVVGLDTALVLGSGPRRQAVVFAGEVMLHVFEVDRAPSAGDTLLRRGRIDHLGFTVPDEAALAVVRRRLVAAGASSGDVRPLGWMLSVRFVDPDGFDGEINCFNPRFDPSDLRERDEIVDQRWLARTRRALHAADPGGPTPRGDRP